MKVEKQTKVTFTKQEILDLLMEKSRITRGDIKVSLRFLAGDKFLLSDLENIEVSCVENKDEEIKPAPVYRGSGK